MQASYSTQGILLTICLSCKDGLTAFHQAAAGGHIPVAQFLLERGANAEAKDNVRDHL